MSIAQLLRSTHSEAVALRSQLFEDQFQHAWGWAQFIDEHFGRPPSVTNILRKGGHDLHAVDFQALFIACWIHFPTEKGSYMIEMSDVQRRNMKEGYQNLQIRMSSHFSGHGRSASWSKLHFLKGYHELLCSSRAEANTHPVR
jgi:hypothetical protein